MINQLINIYPKGFTCRFSVGGSQPSTNATLLLENLYDGSLEATFNAYPNILAGMLDGIQSMLKQPHGCFEQVSSSNYPNILVLELLDKFGDSDLGIKYKAQNYLKSGYKKLTAYEIDGGGFDWYGKAPANEGLSAYGLVQFEDMKKVYAGVNQNVIDRTKNYLLTRRDGNGGFHQVQGKYGFSGNKTEYIIELSHSGMEIVLVRAL